MAKLKPVADAGVFFTDGCGRCALGGTPGCKVHTWESELKMLRRILLDCGLTEDRKWGMPVYTYNSANVVMLAAFKAYCSVSFFKGSLLQDASALLEQHGVNSQATRLFRFTGTDAIIQLETTIKAYVFEAVELEKAGMKVAFKSISEYHVPEEFQRRLDANSALEQAFRGLTAGRQRAYLLYFEAPKQSKTREARIDKYIPVIMQGKGMLD